MSRKDKKILCFVDECGTPGEGDLIFGLLIIKAIHNGRLEKCFSDELQKNANEIHAVSLNKKYIKDLMERFYQRAIKEDLRFVMVNRHIPARKDGTRSCIYASGIIDAVKVGLTTYQKDFPEELLKGNHINNVELIIDRNSYTTANDFINEMSNAKKDAGKFRAVEHIACIDSAASRMLQVADIVASARNLPPPGIKAWQLKERFGIQLK